MKPLKIRKSKDKKSYTCTISNLSLYQLKVIRSFLQQVYDYKVIVQRANGVTLPYLSLDFLAPLLPGPLQSYTIPYIELNDLFGDCLPPRNKILFTKDKPY